MRRALSAAACLMALAGCAHTGPATSREELPGLSYALELVDSPVTRVKVTLALQGAPDGTTTFEVGTGWGGIKNPEDDIQAFSVVGKNSGPIALGHPSGHTWIARHAPAEHLTATYFLVTNHPGDGAHEGYYRPVVGNDVVHLIGNNALVYPTPYAGPTRRPIELRWVGFPEAGWKVASSFGTAADLKVLETLDDFRHAVFVASRDLRLLPRTAGAGTVTLAIVGQWPFADTELADAAARVVAAERDFFSDPGPPFFLVAAVPVGPKADGGGSVSGTSLKNSFEAFMSPGFSLNGMSGERLRWLLGHELFHAWNGAFFRGPHEELVYWFSEGLTNFYSRRLLYRAGVEPLSAYVTQLNDVLSRYMLSPVRDEPNSRIEAEYWTNVIVQQLPYQRGDLVAFLLDREIRRSSANRRSLDDLMRDVVTWARSAHEDTTTEKLLGFVEKETSRAFTDQLRKVVADGVRVDLDPRFFGACLSGAMEQRGPFDLGFDFEGSKEAKRVTGVVPGSSAYLAGLRDGQTLKGWSVNTGDTESPARFKIEDAGSEKKLSYMPTGAKVQVPIFTIADPAACPALL